MLTEEDCQERLDRIYGGQVKLEPKHAAPCGRKAMLARTLRNLKAIYLKAEDYTARAARRRPAGARSSPAALEDLRDRGVLHAALDCYALAAADLEAYLARSRERARQRPGPPEGSRRCA